MNTFIIEPLNPEYETIELRTTNIERFWNCPLNYKEVTPEFTSDAFDFGNVVHNALQSYLFAPEKSDQILDFICKYREDYCDKIISYFNLAKTNLLDEGYDPIVNEMQGDIEIHFGDYKFQISGTADLVFKKRGFDQYIIGDIKTSRAEWKEGVLEKKLQRFMYTYMVGLKIGFENILGFEYYIFTKHVRPRFQLLGTYNMTKESIENILRSIFTSLVYSLKSGDRPAVKSNNCWFCPMRKSGQCSVRGGVNFNL